MINLGFILVFVSLRVTGSYLGKVLLTYKPVLTKIGGIFIFLMGLHMTGILKWSTLYRTYKFHNNSPVTGPLGALLLGVTFAAGRTPRVGPVLGSTLAYAGTSGTGSKVVLLVGVYLIRLSLL